MEQILSVIITAFFVLMVVFVIVVILQGVFYIIYQKSDRRYLSFRTYCYTDSAFFSLYKKGEKVDTILLYSKHNGSFYALGENGFYKFRRGKYQVMECGFSEDERILFEEMKEAARNKLIQYAEMIQSFSERYGITDPETPK